MWWGSGRYAFCVGWLGNFKLVGIQRCHVSLDTPRAKLHRPFRALKHMPNGGGESVTVSRILESKSLPSCAEANLML